jgi:hypothetical protein
MTRSFVRSRRIHNTVRHTLSGAAVSLALAALSPSAQAITFFCDDDIINDNFTCGDQATTTGTFSTAVGDSVAAASGATAIGAQAGAAGGGTAVGDNAS